MTMKALSVAVIAAAITAGATGCGGTGHQARPLSWHSCTGDFARMLANPREPRFRARCGTLSVPASYEDPHGAQIPISVAELVATKPHPIGDIVLNPGGPGGSGVGFLENDAELFPPSLRARFNLVSFDPRGVGASQPLRCLTRDEIKAHAALDLAPSTSQQIDALINDAKGFANGCEDNASTQFIASMSTANTARDMDLLRVALHASKLTYVGFSYGTYLGTLYAEMFPQRVRAMVLDGAVDPALDAERSSAQQAAAFEAELHRFFAWCSSHSECSRRLGPRPAKVYAALMGRLQRGQVIPAHSASLPGLREPLDYGLAFRGVLALLYSKDTWLELGDALATAQRGNGAYLALPAYGLAGLTYNGSFSNFVSANAATGCIDWPSPPTLQAYAALARRLAKSAPDFGSQEAWGGLVCLYWPVRGQGQAVAPAHAPGAPPILVIGSTGDPATPYSWAKALAEQLPRATLLTRIGDGHTAYRSSSCIRKWADRYLETLRMPPAGTRCPSD